MKKNGTAVKLSTKEEQQAWVTFACHAMDLADGDDTSEVCEEAAEIADVMLGEFRKRLG